jgi:hypothetical protein
MLGGINRVSSLASWVPLLTLTTVVDVLPWQPEGNYSHTTVEDNLINGGYATDVSFPLRQRTSWGKDEVSGIQADAPQYGNATMGTNNASAIIKIGIVGLGIHLVSHNGLYLRLSVRGFGSTSQLVPDLYRQS